jgi:hypothetical protein
VQISLVFLFLCEKRDFRQANQSLNGIPSILWYTVPIRIPVYMLYIVPVIILNVVTGSEVVLLHVSFDRLYLCEKKWWVAEFVAR